MLVLVFDTETTGLPKTKEFSLEPEILQKWPHIVQLSYILYDTKDNNVLKVRDHIVKLPKNIVMSQESINIHGITNEMSQKDGVEIEQFIGELFDDFSKVDLVVAHNLEFDLKVLKAECARKIEKINDENEKVGIRPYQMETRFVKKGYDKIHYFEKFMWLITHNVKYYCTMMNSVEICNIEKTNSMGKYLKFPKLCELHEILFKTSPKNLHNSLNDVIICLRCFLKLKFEEDILEKNLAVRGMLEPLL